MKDPNQRIATSADSSNEVGWLGSVSLSSIMKKQIRVDDYRGSISMDRRFCFNTSYLG